MLLEFSYMKYDYSKPLAPYIFQLKTYYPASWNEKNYKNKNKIVASSKSEAKLATLGFYFWINKLACLFLYHTMERKIYNMFLI